MNELLNTLLINGLTASVLALGVAVASRFIRRPAVVHALWVVVLLKLITPPVFEVGLLPATSEFPTAALSVPLTATRVALPELVPETARAALDSAPAAGSLDRGKLVRTGALSIWFSGSLLLLLLALYRGLRFQRLLRGASRAPARLRTRADRLAARIGLSATPQVRVVPARISPMLWFPLSRLQLLLPLRLLERLDRDESDALMAHELAHARRRDHWVRYLELAAGALFWWHPLVWWARRRLRAAEERSCDDFVLRTLPGHSRAYAGGLLKTVEFLAGPAHDMPALASGALDADNLKERLTMILENRTPRKLSRSATLLLGFSALALLVVFPTRADRGDGKAGHDETEASTEQIQKLEQQVIDLKFELRQLQDERLQAQEALEAARREAASERLREEVVALENAGRYEKSRQLKQQAEIKMQMHDLQLEHQRMQESQLVESEEIKNRLHELIQRAEARQQAGDPIGAEQLMDQARNLKLELHDSHARTLEQQLDLERAIVETRNEASREKIERLREQGRLQEAERIDRELDARREYELQLEHQRLLNRTSKTTLDPQDAEAHERAIQKLLLQVDRLRKEQQLLEERARDHDGQIR